MSILEAGNPLLFMKVGTHANEDLTSIIARKTLEIERGGFAMWGYGGNTCHPVNMVRPFADEAQARGRPIRLVMQVMESKHFAEQIPADQYSVDGQEWVDIDTSIHQVLGSRYALFINNLRAESLEFPLAQSKVAQGPCEGRRGDIYIRGRVDKACLLYDPTSIVPGTATNISLVADIVPPYAALLRNRLAAG